MLLEPELQIPFDVWNEDDLNLREAKSADSFFEHSVVFNTYQMAIQATLELMGTRLSPLPVIMPVTASPDTISAVLRSGAQPVLLDIDYLTLQLNPTQLQEALDELKDAIVLLTMPGGQSVDPGIQKQVENLPTIVDTRLVPDHKAPKSLGSFTVYDLGPMCGSGGVVIHKYSPQLKDLRTIRSGQMGHSAQMSWPQVHYMSLRVPYIASRKQDQACVAHSYKMALQAANKAGMIVFKDSLEWPYFLIRVPDAARTVAHLQDHGIEAVLACYPLHLTDELKGRWKDNPEYSTAEKLKEELVALPTYIHILDDEDTVNKIVSILLKVS